MFTSLCVCSQYHAAIIYLEIGRCVFAWEQVFNSDEEPTYSPSGFIASAFLYVAITGRKQNLSYNLNGYCYY